MEGYVNTIGVEEGSGVGGVPGVVRNDTVGRATGVAKNDTVGRRGKVGIAVGISLGVSAMAVLAVDMAVSIISVVLNVAVDRKPLQDASIPPTRNKSVIALPMICIFHVPLMFCKERPNP